MRPFNYSAPKDASEAVKLGQAPSDGASRAPAQFLAGGTAILDLMKLDVMRPEALIDIRRIAGDEMRGIAVTAEGVRLGALVTMADAADHPQLIKTYPVLTESLKLAASAQLRNMATLGGNVLQRTRCSYFRDTSWGGCNKREPGSGCDALEGHNRLHALFGASDQCIASYPGDWAQALIALDAEVDIMNAKGARTINFSQLHRAYDKDPHRETNLEPGDLVTAFSIPAGPHTQRSVYVKVRDRESYAFALTSAAVALHLEGGVVRDVRIALGGVATKPWRASAAEDVLKGKALDAQSAARAADAAFEGAKPHKHNEFKIKLGKETVTRALLQAQAMEI